MNVHVQPVIVNAVAVKKVKEVGPKLDLLLFVWSSIFMMEKRKIFDEFNSELYFFILKKVRQEQITKDVFQNTYLKAFENLHKLKDDNKVRAWLFQIARHEIADYFRQESKYVQHHADGVPVKPVKAQEGSCTGHLCCFDHFITTLPPLYRKVIELVYIKGKKQNEVAQLLQLSLPNVKARIRRAKTMLKEKFSDCCQYDFNKQGKLVGEPNCLRCGAVLIQNIQCK